MSDLLHCFEIDARGDARGSVIWMHGLGASSHDFEDVVPMLAMPHARFVFPDAPQHAVTINGGLIMPAWYDIRSLAGPGRENPEHVRDSAQRIEALVARERERGMPADRIVLAGFSQGAALALFVGVRYPETLAGIMVLSGLELLPETRGAEAGDANRSTPILFCHGTYDPVVDVRLAREAYEAHAQGRPCEWHAFPIEHQMSVEEIDVIRGWLHARLPEDGPEAQP